MLRARRIHSAPAATPTRGRHAYLLYVGVLHEADADALVRQVVDDVAVVGGGEAAAGARAQRVFPRQVPHVQHLVRARRLLTAKHVHPQVR